MRWNTGVKHGLQGVLVDLAALHDDPQMGIGVAQEVQIAIWVAIDHEQVSPCAGGNAAQHAWVGVTVARQGQQFSIEARALVE